MMQNHLWLLSSLFKLRIAFIPAPRSSRGRSTAPILAIAYADAARRPATSRCAAPSASASANRIARWPGTTTDISKSNKVSPSLASMACDLRVNPKPDLLHSSTMPTTACSVFDISFSPSSKAGTSWPPIGLISHGDRNRCRRRPFANLSWCLNKISQQHRRQGGFEAVHFDELSAGFVAVLYVRNARQSPVCAVSADPRDVLHALTSRWACGFFGFVGAGYAPAR